MQFVPDDNENRFLEHALEGSVGLVNFVFQRLPLDLRQRLNGLIFSGAEVMVSVTMCPIPSVVGTIRANGQSLELFKIETPPETQPETQH